MGLKNILRRFPSGSVVKDLPEMQEPQETQVRSLGWEDLLEEGMATHSSILAWSNPMNRGVKYRPTEQDRMPGDKSS